MDQINDLWDSTASLYQRFGVQNTPILKRQRIFIEETLELIQASTLHDCEIIMGEEIDPDSLEHIVEEAADVIVTVMGVLMAHRIDLEDLQDAMSKVADKNNAKTHETHSVDAKGKISRR